jgi:hypothetical protein
MFPFTRMVSAWRISGTGWLQEAGKKARRGISSLRMAVTIYKTSAKGDDERLRELRSRLSGDGGHDRPRPLFETVSPERKAAVL